jgi:hypothetical protein
MFAKIKQELGDDLEHQHNQFDLSDVHLRSSRKNLEKVFYD